MLTQFPKGIDFEDEIVYCQQHIEKPTVNGDVGYWHEQHTAAPPKDCKTS
jgi:hypothetical protein